MQRFLFPVFVVLAAGLTMNFALPALLIAAVTAIAAQRIYLHRFHRTSFWSAVLDPAKPDGNILAAAIREAVRTVQSLDKPIILRLIIPESPQNIRFALRMAKPMDLVLEQAGTRPRALGIGTQWIPDFPIPLALPAPSRIALLFRPTESGRVHIEIADPFSIPVPACISLLFAAICGGVLGVPLIAAVCVSVCIGLLWLPRMKFCC
jgi:hypothetical protein